MGNKLLVLDFDGTLCLGDDPVLAYAAQVDAMLAQRQFAGRLPRPVHTIVAEALSSNQLLAPEISYRPDGTPDAVAEEVSGEEPTHQTEAHPLSWPLQDGYQLTQLLAHQAGLTGAESGHCFRQARRDLVAAGLENTDLHAPAGAAELLDELRCGAVVVLITNSPAAGFAPWLEVLGLAESFHAVINNARKPFGMPQALDAARAAAEASAAHNSAASDSGGGEDVLSIGDIWRNDLAHVSAEGGSTILIDRFTTGLGVPDHRVADWAEAVPALRSWAAA